MDFQNWAASQSQDNKRLNIEQGPGGDHDRPYIFLPLTTLTVDGVRVLIRTMRRFLRGEVGGKYDGLEQGPQAPDDAAA